MTGDAITDDTFEIPISTLRPGAAVEFSLYTRVGGEFVLFSQPGRVLSRDQWMVLLQSGNSQVTLAGRDRALYYAYLERHVLELLDDGEVGDAERVDRHYGVGEMVSRRLLDEPEATGTEQLTLQWVGSTRRMIAEVEEVLAGMMRLLTVDADLYQHSLHVAFYGLALARELDLLAGAELDDLGIGLLLHDIGLLDLPPAITEANRELTEEEWRVVRQHPRTGHERVAGLEWLGPIAREVILHHHECLDGSGYPEGLSGDAVTPAARVAAIANSFDSRTTTRIYRKAGSTLTVLRGMIQDGRGRTDPRYLATFVRMLS